MAVLRDREAGKMWPLNGKVVLIGRDPACDIVVASPKTSGRHAMMVSTGGEWFIEDLNSVNGTRVNGTIISQRTQLRHEDRVEMFGLSATFDESQDIGTVSPYESVHVDESMTEGLAPILSSCEMSGDLRLAVRPEAKLRAVLEISQNLSNTFDLKQVLPKILESLFSIFPQADCGCILLVDGITGQLVPRAVRHRHHPESKEVPLSRSIIDYVVRTGVAVLSADAGSDTRFDPTQSISVLNIRSIMCIPMVSQTGARLGIIQIDTRNRKNQFRQDDLDLIACACVQVARTVELVQMHEERRDMEAATRIQKSFLPAERPRHEQLRFFDYYSPARHVGGDYYDYIPLQGGRLAVALGDVSGKGMSAALLMARVSAAVRFSLASAPTVADAVRELNRSLLREHSEERFVTFVVAVLDVQQARMTLVNAGHIPPLLRRPGEAPKEIGDEIVGLPLAVMDRPYQEVNVALEPGDTILLCTDGVTEARNTAGEMYGSERLNKAMQEAPAGIEELGNRVLEDVRRFAGTRPQNDDLTIVCFDREK
jgi:phosphoserine phosphatase RsbU/P